MCSRVARRLACLAISLAIVACNPNAIETRPQGLQELEIDDPLPPDLVPENALDDSLIDQGEAQQGHLTPRCGTFAAKPKDETSASPILDITANELFTEAETAWPVNAPVDVALSERSLEAIRQINGSDGLTVSRSESRHLDSGQPEALFALSDGASLVIRLDQEALQHYDRPVQVEVAELTQDGLPVVDELTGRGRAIAITADLPIKTYLHLELRHPNRIQSLIEATENGTESGLFLAEETFVVGNSGNVERLITPLRARLTPEGGLQVAAHPVSWPEEPVEASRHRLVLRLFETATPAPVLSNKRSLDILGFGTLFETDIPDCFFVYDNGQTAKVESTLYDPAKPPILEVCGWWAMRRFLRATHPSPILTRWQDYGKHLAKVYRGLTRDIFKFPYVGGAWHPRDPIMVHLKERGDACGVAYPSNSLRQIVGPWASRVPPRQHVYLYLHDTTAAKTRHESCVISKNRAEVSVQTFAHELTHSLVGVNNWYYARNDYFVRGNGWPAAWRSNRWPNWANEALAQWMEDQLLDEDSNFLTETADYPALFSGLASVIYGVTHPQNAKVPADDRLTIAGGYASSILYDYLMYRGAINAGSPVNNQIKNKILGQIFDGGFRNTLNACQSGSWSQLSKNCPYGSESGEAVLLRTTGHKNLTDVMFDMVDGYVSCKVGWQNDQTPDLAGKMLAEHQSSYPTDGHRWSYWWYNFDCSTTSRGDRLLSHYRTDNSATLARPDTLYKHATEIRLLTSSAIEVEHPYWWSAGSPAQIPGTRGPARKRHAYRLSLGGGAPSTNRAVALPHLQGMPTHPQFPLGTEPLMGKTRGHWLISPYGGFQWLRFDFEDKRSSVDLSTAAGNGKELYFKFAFAFSSLTDNYLQDENADNISVLLYISKTDGSMTTERYRLGELGRTRVLASDSEEGRVELVVPLGANESDRFDVTTVALALINNGTIEGEDQKFLTNLAYQEQGVIPAPYTQFAIQATLGARQRCDAPLVRGRLGECVCKEDPTDPETKYEAWKAGWVAQTYDVANTEMRRCRLVPPCERDEFWIKADPNSKQSTSKCWPCDSYGMTVEARRLRVARAYFTTGLVQDHMRCFNCAQGDKSEHLVLRSVNPQSNALLSSLQDNTPLTCGCPNDIHTDNPQTNGFLAIDQSSCRFPCSHQDIRQRGGTPPSQAVAWNFGSPQCRLELASTSRASACCMPCAFTDSATSSLYDGSIGDRYDRCGQCGNGGAYYVATVLAGTAGAVEVDQCASLAIGDYSSRTRRSPFFNVDSCPIGSNHDPQEISNCICQTGGFRLTQPWNAAQKCPEACNGSQYYDWTTLSCKSCGANADPTQLYASHGFNDSCKCRSGYSGNAKTGCTNSSSGSGTGSGSGSGSAAGAGYTPPKCYYDAQAGENETHYTGPFVDAATGSGTCCLSLLHHSYDNRPQGKFYGGQWYCCGAFDHPSYPAANCVRSAPVSDPCWLSGGTYRGGASGWGCYKS